MQDNGWRPASGRTIFSAQACHLTAALSGATLSPPFGTGGWCGACSPGPAALPGHVENWFGFGDCRVMHSRRGTVQPGYSMAFSFWLHTVGPVSYTHLTLPTILRLPLSVVVFSFKQTLQTDIDRQISNRSNHTRQYLIVQI